MTQITKTKRQRLEYQAIQKNRTARNDAPIWYKILKPFIYIALAWSILNVFLLLGNALATGLFNLILLVALNILNSGLADKTMQILMLSLVGSVFSYGLAGLLIYTTLDIVRRSISNSEISGKLKNRFGLLSMIAACLLTSHFLLSYDEDLLTRLDSSLKAPIERQI